MNRLLIAQGLALLTAASLGCATCGHPGDCFYPAYGGIWQRYDQSHGRVGSVFDPDGGPGGEAAAMPEGVIYEGEMSESEPYYELVPTPAPVP